MTFCWSPLTHVFFSLFLSFFFFFCYRWIHIKQRGKINERNHIYFFSQPFLLRSSSSCAWHQTSTNGVSLVTRLLVLNYNEDDGKKRAGVFHRGTIMLSRVGLVGVNLYYWPCMGYIKRLINILATSEWIWYSVNKTDMMSTLSIMCGSFNNNNDKYLPSLYW